MTKLRRHPLAALAVAAVLTVTACGTDGAVFELTPASDAHALLADAPADLVILDIRTPEEYSSGHIAGASNLDYYEPDFADSLDTLPKDLPYFVYCRTGNRSAGAIEIMRDLGFSAVYELEGGIVAWAQAGLPIE